MDLKSVKSQKHKKVLDTLEIFLMNCIMFAKRNITKKEGLYKKRHEEFNYKKLRLGDDYLYESEDKRKM